MVYTKRNRFLIYNAMIVLFQKIKIVTWLFCDQLLKKHLEKYQENNSLMKKRKKKNLIKKLGCKVMLHKTMIEQFMQ